MFKKKIDMSNITYKTDFETIVKVYQFMKRLGLDSIVFGFSEENEDDIVKRLHNILECLLVPGIMNEFCITITGEKWNFEKMDLVDLESVILGFFDATDSSFRKLLENIRSRKM